MAGLVVTIGGKMDSSYPAMLEKAVVTSKSAALRMQQQSVQKGIIKQQGIIAGLTSADAAEAIGRAKYVQQEQLKLRLLQSATLRAQNQTEVAAAKAADAELVASNRAKIEAIVAQEKLAGRAYDDEKMAQMAMADMAAAEEVAAAKAAQLAMVKAVAAGGTSSAMGHGGGGSGILRETLVIFRELGRGNMTRVPGSLLLLLQYTGMLKLMMRNEKTEALLAAAAQDKLAQSTARAAMAAQAKLLSAQKAAGVDMRSPELKAAESELAAAAATAEGARAEATTLAAGAESQSADATAANLLALEAEADLALKSAVAETLRARASAAAAATAKASAATTAGAMALMVLPVLLLVAAMVAWYIAIKNAIGWLHKKNAALAEATEIADRYHSSVADQIEAEEKLAEAIKKTTDALHKMNEAKDHSVEIAEEAIAAAKAEAEANSKLYDAQVKGKLIDIEIAEKTGQISKPEAIKRKADVESQAVADKVAAEQAALDKEAAISQQAADKAKADKVAAQQAFQSASDAVNKSPEGIKLAKQLDDAEKIKKVSAEGAEEARKEKEKSLTSGLFGGKNQKDFDAWQHTEDEQNAAAKGAEALIIKLKAKMSPAEIAAADAETKANEATSASTALDEAAKKAAAAAAAHAKNSPAEVTAEQANIKKQERLDLLGSDKGPQNLNAMQKVGAFTAQGNNPLVDLAKSQDQRLARIDANQAAWMNYIRNRQGGVTH